MADKYKRDNLIYKLTLYFLLVVVIDFVASFVLVHYMTFYFVLRILAFLPWNRNEVRQLYKNSMGRDMSSEQKTTQYVIIKLEI